MNYHLAVVPSARRELLSLPDDVIRRIDHVINLIAETPRPYGYIKLKGVNAYRIRVGKYRIIYDIDDKLKRINILAIGHRREIYR
ncbi:MAG: type II toxin-antitoxin system RelE/ParE family toxin [Planctomycetota bacterium]